MKKTIATMLLIILVLMMSTLACIGGGGGDGNGSNSGSPSACCNSVDVQATQATSATETYGAEEFYIQMTAIAGQNQ